MRSRPRSVKAGLSRRLEKLEQKLAPGGSCPCEHNPVRLETPSRKPERDCPVCGRALIIVRLSFEPPLVEPDRLRVDLSRLSDDELEELRVELRRAHSVPRGGTE